MTLEEEDPEEGQACPWDHQEESLTWEEEDQEEGPVCPLDHQEEMAVVALVAEVEDHRPEEHLGPGSQVHQEDHGSLVHLVLILHVVPKREQWSRQRDQSLSARRKQEGQKRHGTLAGHVHVAT